MIYLAYHDVCINNFQKVREHLGLIREILPEVQPALMVVANPHLELSQRPNFEGPGTESDLVEFRAFLDQHRDHGGLIFQHGLTHFADEKYSRSLTGRMANSRVSQEAEFAGLEIEGCKELLELTDLAWDSLDLGTADGFIAPTWHAPKFLQNILRNSSLRFFESRSQIVNLHNSRTYKTPSLSFWGKDPAQFKSSLKWNQRYYRLNRMIFKDVKLALHPSDFQTDRQQLVLKFIQNLAPSEKFSSYPL